ncbi:MAG: chromate efflux transporter [Pseudomonadota bacterium]|nr:chromate efflux transporter [Pseudomonadota bacterium]
MTSEGALPAELPVTPTLREALRFWTWLGFVSFGGPAGQIAVMHRELVDGRRWISEKRFLHALQYCMVLPGPEAQQLATYIGWLLHGTIGGIAAGALFVLPSLGMLIGLAWLYVAHGDLPVVTAVLSGVRPAVVAVVLGAAWRIGKRTLRHPALVALAVAAFVGIYVFDVPFPWIVLGAALVGAVGGRLAPGAFAVGGGHAPVTGGPGGAAVLDHDTPLPAWARFSPARLAMQGATALAMWGVAYGGLLAAAGGGESTLARMARFFTQAALLTFGGAYAVLPYVYQGAVDTHGWLQGPQMMDGLALGEATPGPLIMVVTWVGFLGGWQVPVPGWPVALSAVAAALVATFYTFLPSFLFILAGGPLVEATRDMPRLSAPLAGVTAAVVGVIVNLAVFFAVHAIFPHGTGAAPDLLAIVVGIGAGVAVFRYDAGVMKLLLVAAFVGWIASLVR